MAGFLPRAAMLGALAACATSAGGVRGGPPSYQFDVRPILARNCFACHGPDESHREADLRLDERDPAVAAGALVPGDSVASEVMRRIEAADPEERMPPAERGRTLSAADIEILRAWIDSGAAYQRHWSFEPPRRQPPPAVRRDDWVRNDIDRFVLARLEAARLEPAPEADRGRLARRVALDLTGLPPTTDEVERFAADRAPGAYERLVDRLLASPAYGEHMAARWLDLVRYADTRGYEADQPRSMWAYRDWVIDAFNADMPFDQFTLEQLAGDLLPEPTTSQIHATAMHRNTMQNDEGGTDNEEYRVAAVVDRVNVTMQVWMGVTMGCCQCHSHKYDPLAQREYYELFAFFNQTADADLKNQSPTTPTPTAEQARQLAEVQQKERTVRVQAEALPEGSAARVALNVAAAEAHRQAEALEVDRLPIMQELPADKRRVTRLLDRGSFLTPLEPVEPGTPAAFPPFPSDQPRNRLGLARWLVSRENPLTARVAANRMWEQLFGVGLTPTSEDFGSQGALPSHPELLDWLALRLIDGGWSLKTLAREIVLSAAYRQSAEATPEKLRRDPANALVARGPRVRLSAEQIRDQALSVAGLLSAKMYGPSVMPYQPEGVWAVVYSNEKWQTSPGEDRRRRALYTFWRRSSPYPSAVALDAVSRERCTIRRVLSNTPVAAMTLLNDPAYVEAAQALARQIARQEASTTAERAAYGFRRVLCRPPEPAETERLVQLYESLRARYADDLDAARRLATDPLGPAAEAELPELAAWTVVSNVLLNLDETLTH